MKPQVLVVEDEDALATLLQYNLEKEGYAVAVARDGEEALIQAEETTPDLVLCDCCLLYTSPSPRDRTRSRMPSSA